MIKENNMNMNIEIEFTLDRILLNLYMTNFAQIKPNYCAAKINTIL